MTPQQVSTKTRVHVSDVRRALENGELHGHQKVKGGHWRIDPDCVDPWVIGLESIASCCCRRLRVAARRAS
jgi:excisionase family DNA binding protein